MTGAGNAAEIRFIGFATAAMGKHDGKPYDRETWSLPEMVVMSGFGRSSDWLRNIAAAPGLEVVVGATKRFPAVYRILGERA
jgi:hypothetical protein